MDNKNVKVNIAQVIQYETLQSNLISISAVVQCTQDSMCTAVQCCIYTKLLVCPHGSYVIGICLNIG